MASGWRKLLEEESEHQWLALGLFLVFVVIGGFLIGGTRNLEGMVLGVDSDENFAFDDGHHIIEIAYHANSDWDGAHSAILLNSSGMKMYQQLSSADVNDIVPFDDELIRDVTFFESDEEGTVTYSAAQNTITTVVNAMPSNQILDDGTGSSFSIQGIAKDTSDLILNNRVLITSEDGGSGVRGLGMSGVTISSSPDPSVSWTDLVFLEADTYIATGVFTYHDDNPALLGSKIVFAHITWAGGSNVPQVLISSVMGNGSEVHSLTSMKNGLAAAASNQEAYIISKDSIEIHSISATAMVYEPCEHRLWFFGEQGSKSILRMDVETGEETTKNLQYALPLQPTFVLIEGDSLYIHGYDNKGEPDRLSLDLSLEGSMSSGRGFLNFLFLFAGVLMLGTQLYTIIDRTLLQKKR
tara:strand:+ start:2648 stop:3880 length:1233 start_codon:yes stop_codon:yes gene_type:complete